MIRVEMTEERFINLWTDPTQHVWSAIAHCSGWGTVSYDRNPQLAVEESVRQLRRARGAGA